MAKNLFGIVLHTAQRIYRILWGANKKFAIKIAIDMWTPFSEKENYTANKYYSVLFK